MKLIVNQHTTEIITELVNEKEINVTKVEFEFNDIPENYVKDAFFTYGDSSYKRLIVNNECDIPYEVLNKKGQVEIGVVAYEVENGVQIKRYNPSPSYFPSFVGSLKEDYENAEEVTPTDKEQVEQAIQDMEVKIDNLDIDVSKEGTVATVTVTKKDGTQESVEILDGENGIPGQDGADGLTPTIGNNGNWYLGETDTGKPSRGIQGETGAPGSAGQDGISPIASVTKSGNMATITITDKNGTTTATVSDGTNGVDGQPGRDGYRQYTAGDNITIENDVISADVDLSDYYNKEDVDELISGIGGGFNENNIYSGTTTNPFNFDNKQGIYIADGTATTNYFYYKLNEEDTSKMISVASGRIYMMAITKKINDVASGIESIGVAIFVDNSNFLDQKGNFNILDLRYDADNHLIKLGAAVSPLFKMLTSTEQNIQGRKNFQTIPFLGAGLTPQFDAQLVHKKYVDDSIRAAITTTLGGNY